MRQLGAVAEEAAGTRRDGVEIRRVRPTGWPELRALRLRALTEDSDAVARSLGEGQDLPGERWQDAARGVIYVAVEADEWAGMAGVHEAEPGTAEIWGMWVRPERRHQGMSRALLDAALEWARTEGFPSVRLGVT